MGGFASLQLPALDIHPPESPLQQVGGALQIANAVQQREKGEIELEQARAIQQSQQTLMSLYARNNGDLNATYRDAADSGQVLPEHLLDFRTQSIAAQVAAANLDEKRLTNLSKIQGMAADALEAVKAAPEAQRGDEIKRQFGVLVNAGVDPNQLLPALNGLPDYSDASINKLETAFMGSKWLVENEQAQRALASAPTIAQAQAKTAAELEKAQTDALIAHQNLLNLPTPEEARSTRMADLRETMAKTAQAQADTAEKIASTQLIGAQPVFAFDPATNTRVLTTMPQAGAKGFTNPVKASEGDINKETELSRQFNDVQMNLSRYRLAVNNPNLRLEQNGIFGASDTTKIANILSDTKLAGVAGQIPAGERLGDIISQGKNAKYWNELSPEAQDIVAGYLRAKGSVIAFQKALTQTGRTSKEALAIEMQNLPSPIEGTAPANKQLDAFQENIDVASKGIVRVPWLPTTQEVRQSIEESPAAKVQSTPYPQVHSGQYRGTPSQDTGRKQYAVGMVVEGLPGGPKTVTKVYPDGSFDAQ